MTEADVYRVNVPVITSDGVELILEVDVSLVDKRIGGRKWNPPQTWLDNFYRPVLMQRVQVFVTEYAEADIKSNLDEFRNHLQLIANGVCDQLPLPQ